MPFSIDKPKDLPENVQKLSDTKKRQWISVWNSSNKSCMAKDGADKDKCESSAFAQANSAVSEEEGKRADSHPNSAMVAFYLPDEVAAQLALSIPGAIPADELHLTLAYLGKVEDITPAKAEDLKRAVALWAKERIPVDVRVNGIARFTKTNDEGAQPIVALLDSKHLTSLQYTLDSYIRYDGDFDYKSDCHFLPHVTLAYVFPDALWPVQNLPELRFTLREVILKIGEVRYTVQLTGEMRHEPGEMSRELSLPILKAGARNNQRDLDDIQDIHDKAAHLGAECIGTSEHRDKEKDDMHGKSAIKTIWTCGVEDHEHATPKEAHECIRQTTLNTPAVRAEFVKSAYSNNCLKTVSKTEDELVVANYMVLFGGRDLEGLASPRINPDGSKGEYFTKATKFESDHTATGQLLVDWEHRTQPDGVGPDDEDIFGYVDWKTAIIDDTGLFVKRVLNRRNRYIKMLETLFDAGLLGSSSEPIQKGVAKEDNGEITDWPLRRDSFSVSPMDPRMLAENHLQAVKALKSSPEGVEIYNKLFQIETATAKATALSLISQIGEAS